MSVRRLSVVVAGILVLGACTTGTVRDASVADPQAAETTNSTDGLTLAPDENSGTQSTCQPSSLGGEIGNQLAGAFACLTSRNQEIICDKYRVAGIQSTFEYFEGRGAFSTQAFPEGQAFSAFASGVTTPAAQDSLNIFLHSICRGADQLPIVFSEPTINLLDILREVAQRGYYVAEGSTEATTGTSAIVQNPRLIWLVLAKDYPDGATELANEVLARVKDADTVVVITPNQIGGASSFKTSDEVSAATDGLLRVLQDGGNETDAIDAFRVVLGY